VFGLFRCPDLRLPGTESQQATDLLASRFPPQQNGSSPFVFHVAKGKITDKANKQAVESACKALSKAPHVHSAPDPFANAASGLVGKDATTAFTPVLLDIPNGDVTEELADSLLETTAPARKAGVDVAVGGNLGSVLSHSPTESSEAIGLLAAMLILALTFGSLVAMGMPIITAVVGLATALGLIGLLGHLFKIPTVGPTLATMIGLGVGIAYALFLVTRHRDQLAAGVERHESIARAVATSGGAIVFAGGTVIIALLSLRVADIPLVASLGYASAVAVFTAVLAAITLLPAVLSLVGRHLFGARLPAFLRPRAEPGAATFWSRWAATVTGHPLACGLVALALLAPLVVPMFSLHLGQEDVAATPEATTERQAFDLLAGRYGPGYNGPLVTATQLSPPARPSQAYQDKYDQAKANQADLERKQKELTAEANSLKAQQARPGAAAGAAPGPAGTAPGPGPAAAAAAGPDQGTAGRAPGRDPGQPQGPGRPHRPGGQGQGPRPGPRAGRPAALPGGAADAGLPAGQGRPGGRPGVPGQGPAGAGGQEGRPGVAQAPGRGPGP
jgi:uncharacterized membrane protein YdfJ with MMPL/SSD domain